ncbi:MAG: hypothetical protein QM770_13065 [Tepidisphaeraceae bacterium]
MKIVLGGYIVGYPLGGMTWHHLNYLLGLVDLGHDVTFLEDGAYHSPWNPTTDLNGDPTFGLQYLQATFAAYGLTIPWHYRYGTFSAGISIDAMQQALRSADLFIAVSGVTPTAWYPMPKRSLVIDTDPVFTQIRLTHDQSFLDYYKGFTHQATFGELIGTANCPLPTAHLSWIPTRQPIALKHWPMTPINPNAKLTTVGKWEHAADRHLELAGKRYLSSKRTEYERLIDLPKQANTSIELGMAGIPEPDAARYVRHGWKPIDAVHTTRDCPSYQSFIRASLGEFSVAKQIYSGLKSGWFSDRSACFLASGRPVILQATGFEQVLPTGEGLHAFESIDDAERAVRAVTGNPMRESKAARALAEAHFDSRKVLSALLDRIV